MREGDAWGVRMNIQSTRARPARTRTRTRTRTVTPPPTPSSLSPRLLSHPLALIPPSPPPPPPPPQSNLQQNLQLVVNVAREYREQLTEEKILEMFDSRKCHQGVFFFLQSFIMNTDSVGETCGGHLHVGACRRTDFYSHASLVLAPCAYSHAAPAPPCSLPSVPFRTPALVPPPAPAHPHPPPTPPPPISPQTCTAATWRPRPARGR